MRRVLTWNGTAGTFADTTGIAQFNRFCSADLPPRTGFYNPATGQGFDGLHLHERRGGRRGRPRVRSRRHRRREGQRPTSCPTSASSRGRTRWRTPTPATGRLSWASTTRRPGRSTSTSATSRITATRSSAPDCRTARCYGIKVTNGGANYAGGAVPLENAARSTAASLCSRSRARRPPALGAALQGLSVANDVTEFARPEDGHWDTQNPNVFYWVTTGATLGGKVQSAKLYKLTFDSLANPTGGTIELVVDAATLTGTDGATGALVRQHGGGRRRQRPRAGGPGRQRLHRQDLEDRTAHTDCGADLRVGSHPLPARRRRIS